MFINEKETLKEELNHRICLINNSILETECGLIKKQLKLESMYYNDFLSMVNHYDRLEYKLLREREKYTPFLCEKTKTPILLNDKVENEKKQCGWLSFDPDFNEYVIITNKESKGRVRFRKLTIISELYQNEIDTINVECRRNTIVNH